MKSILVVEDELDILETLEMLLAMEGYKVLTASNGRDALKVLSENPVDLVLSDVMMPVLTGLEMLDSVRGDPRHREIPVILMSAANVRPKSGPHGWTEFMKKPVEMEQLLATVDRVLKQKKAA